MMTTTVVRHVLPSCAKMSLQNSWKSPKLPTCWMPTTPCRTSQAYLLDGKASLSMTFTLHVWSDLPISQSTGSSKPTLNSSVVAHSLV